MSQTNISDGTRYKQAPSEPIYDDSDGARFQRVPNASINMFMFGTRYKRVPFGEPYEKIGIVDKMVANFVKTMPI